MNKAENTTIIKVAIGTLAFVLVAAFFTWYFVLPRVGQQEEQATDAATVFLRSQYDAASSAHDRLKSTNAAYAQANQLRRAGEYADAAKAYRSALASASDVTESTEIKFWLGHSDAAAGNYVEAVATYKELAAASTTLSRVTRAYAVQNLGHMYYRYGDPVITREVFKDRPYKNFFNVNRIPRSYRNLFDYAARLHPLAYSVLSSADWYANQLLAGTTTRPEYKDIIRQKLQLAEQDLASIRDDAARRNTFLNAFEKRAEILSKMKRIGDTSFADPDAAFKELLNYYETYQLRGDGTARLQYAYHLANVYGKERIAEIENILAPINADPSAHGVVTAHILKSGRSYRGSVKANLVLLASIDPAFKKTLLSLDWTEADFK